MEKVLLQMKGIEKEFPGVKALDGVSLNAYEGKVMALLGENGAGKSTLMKIVSGVYKRTAGEILFEGKPVHFKNTRESQEGGIAIIHQELNLIDHLTIGENIFLGREPRNAFGVIRWKALYEEAEQLMQSLGMRENVKAKVADLSIGKKQMVEIAKALSIHAKLIIMDEPTDALTDKETESLFAVIRALKAQHKSIIYISHRLKEIFEICDDVTILRDGTFIAESPVSEMDESRLIEMMVGRKLEDLYPRLEVEIKAPILEVKNLKNKHIRNINFNLREGEILGIAGLMGSQRTELAKTIVGAIASESGEIFLRGTRKRFKNTGEAIENGITYVSEDRKGDGLILSMSVKENMSLSALKKMSVAMVINKREESEKTESMIESMSIKTPSVNQRVKNLSGGNQQKVSIGKSLLTGPDILILDEPTRGVDVGAKKEIYELMNQFKKKGMSIIMISSEIPEILGMSDRVMVMHEGTVSGILEIKEATQEKIMKLAIGSREDLN
ncbi:ribose ABC transporter ATP-binding protein RbsA [Fusibacter sp. 3D3]|uniref:ribose ABC transporter ATP-binding protein RbsA n=1 Tax=Fusibacter sp. 3D3 TaxID=1048380 RepID=UPI0008535214|nr:ribose ABC transporter ATP-binding protein RbsA [Fusibacter sp. 3D3]GAU75851.1 ribose ABC transport system, ATP-binding protein RbsA [Fusibacter sp. 3D3]